MGMLHKATLGDVEALVKEGKLAEAYELVRRDKSSRGEFGIEVGRILMNMENTDFNYLIRNISEGEDSLGRISADLLTSGGTFADPKKKEMILERIKRVKENAHELRKKLEIIIEALKRIK